MPNNYLVHIEKDTLATYKTNKYIQKWQQEKRNNKIW